MQDQTPLDSHQECDFEDEYLPTYADMLVEHLSGGFTIDSFVGVIGIDIATIMEWTKSKPDFAKAFMIGEARARRFYEELAQDGMKGVYRGFNAGVLKMIMEERFGYGQKKDPNKDGNNVTKVTLYLPNNNRLSGSNADSDNSGPVLDV